MALVSISEPGQSGLPLRGRCAVGIDLGTTCSSIAIVHDGVAEILPDASGVFGLPSVVRYMADAEPRVGVEAEAGMAEDPYSTLVSVKRLLSAADVPGAQIHTVAGNASPQQVIAEILICLKQRARQRLGDELPGVVMTVPACFDARQCEGLMEAAELAGLRVRQLIPEPLAAALACDAVGAGSGTMAVYRLGGGSFDVAIVDHQGEELNLLASEGDCALGGDALDRIIAQWILAQAGVEAETLSDTTRCLLMQQARVARETLDRELQVELNIRLDESSTWFGSLNQDTYAQLAQPLLEATLRSCRRVLEMSGVDPDGIETLLMVGGLSRNPALREKVAAVFGCAPLDDVEVAQMAVVGAAVRAASLDDDADPFPDGWPTAANNGGR